MSANSVGGGDLSRSLQNLSLSNEKPKKSYVLQSLTFEEAAKAAAAASKKLEEQGIHKLDQKEMEEACQSIQEALNAPSSPLRKPPTPRELKSTLEEYPF